MGLFFIEPPSYSKAPRVCFSRLSERGATTVFEAKPKKTGGEVNLGGPPPEQAKRGDGKPLSRRGKAETEFDGATAKSNEAQGAGSPFFEAKPKKMGKHWG